MWSYMCPCTYVHRHVVLHVSLYIDVWSYIRTCVPAHRHVVLHVSLYIYMWSYMCPCTYVDMWSYTCPCTYIDMWSYMCPCTYVDMWSWCVFACSPKSHYTWMCVPVRTYAHKHTHMQMYVRTYIHMHVSPIMVMCSICGANLMGDTLACGWLYWDVRSPADNRQVMWLSEQI